MISNKYISKIIIAIMSVAVILCILAVAFSDKLEDLLGDRTVKMEYETELFDTDEIISINIDMDEEEWKTMLENATSEEYYVCDVTVNGKTFKAGDKVLMNSRASLFSGGAFSKAKMKQTAVLSFVPFRLDQPEGEEPFVFEGAMTEKDYAPETLFSAETAADKDGVAENDAKLVKSGKPSGKIRFETKVFDESGRSASSFASADYFAVNHLVGLRSQKETVQVGKSAFAEYVVADTDRNLIAGVPVTISVTRTENKLVREKSAGNAYLMKYVKQEKQVAECMGVSALESQKCSFTPDKSGLYQSRRIPYI